ncbi:hypothetical protein DUI87_27931 [Hirundo rustica rustica]|uniref:G-protein coupled receptors family 1 profile domain-containing protein n=1 Tax=Hirundo rustica rustica TaxID=333673 RepID=A0A3M0J419_HIRRU|nr:hypothetical protein DUI87_27931 [Hirundo rustica rustica]
MLPRQYLSLVAHATTLIMGCFEEQQGRESGEHNNLIHDNSHPKHEPKKNGITATGQRGEDLDVGSQNQLLAKLSPLEELMAGVIQLETALVASSQHRERRGEDRCPVRGHVLLLCTRWKVNSFISFVFPMVVISVLNTIIANQLLVMFKQAAQENQVCTIGGQQTMLSMSMEPSRVQALKHGVRVLRERTQECRIATLNLLDPTCEKMKRHRLRVTNSGAVVIAFVVCWLPYHIRRLMFCYVPSSQWTDFLYNFYHYFYMLTNVLFYVSSAINPILYNLVSANFRQIFLSTLTILCLPWRKKKKRLAFTRKSNSISSNHTFSSQVTRETTY